MKKLSSIITVCCLICAGWAYSQDNYLEQEIKPTELTQEDWEEITSDRNYDEKAKPVQKTQEVEDMPDFDWQGLGWIKYLMIALLVSLVVFLLVKIISAKENTKVSDQKVSYEKLEELEGNIEEADLEGFLRRALDSGDYRLAFRVLYLITLREMGQKEWISYRKDKTNFNYVLEMSARPQVKQFTKLTRIFELVWYGEHEFGKNEYDQVDRSFQDYLKAVRRDER